MSAMLESNMRENCMVISFKGRFIEEGQKKTMLHQMKQLIVDPNDRFLIDMSQVEHMNSTGFTLLVQVVNEIKQHNGRLVFTSVPENVHELLDIIKLNAVLAIRGTVDEGIEYLN